MSIQFLALHLALFFTFVRIWFHAHSVILFQILEMLWQSSQYFQTHIAHFCAVTWWHIINVSSNTLIDCRLQCLSANALFMYFMYFCLFSIIGWKVNFANKPNNFMKIEINIDSVFSSYSYILSYAFYKIYFCFKRL